MFHSLDMQASSLKLSCIFRWRLGPDWHITMCIVVYCLDSCHIRVCLISAIWLHILCTSTFSRVIVFINCCMFGWCIVFLDVISVSGAQGSSLCTDRIPQIVMYYCHSASSFNESLTNSHTTDYTQWNDKTITSVSRNMNVRCVLDNDILNITADVSC